MAQPAFGDVGPYFSFVYGDGGLPGDIANVAGQQISADGNTLQLYGDCGPITGAEFGFGFVLDWDGSFQGPISPGDTFTVGLDFNVQVTGGTVSWDLYADLWSNEGYEDAQIVTDPTPVPQSGLVSGAQFASSAFNNPGQTGIYSGYLHLDWSGYSPTDTLTVSIPQGSIDTTYVPVPEPGVVSLMFAAGAAFAFRRFKTG